MIKINKPATPKSQKKYTKRNDRVKTYPSAEGILQHKFETDKIKNDYDSGQKLIIKDSVYQQYKEELSNIILNGRSTEGAAQKNDGPETWPQLDFLDQ